MEYKNFKIIKIYLLMIICAFTVLFLFIYLEKNDKSKYFLLNNENELNPQSIHVLNKIKDKSVIFEIFTNSDSAIAKKIKLFFVPYLHINNNIQLRFIDPIKNPNEVKQNAVTMQGEMILRIEDSNSKNKINITVLSESSIINAILKLINNNDDWVVVAEGYGMSNITDESDQGLSHLLIHLKKTGYKVARMPLNTSVVLPENVKLLIFPSPTTEIDGSSVKWIKDQIDDGISIWWLNDVDVNNQSILELVLGVMSSKKVTLDNNEYTAYVSEFAKHQITENFNQPIYIAQAREIIADSFKPLFVNKDQISFAVTKQIEKSRVVITGDADFIRNQYLDSAANKSMAVRIIDWLLHNDDRVNIPVKINQNTQLLLSQNQLLLISVLILVIMPLVFISVAFFQWRKNSVNNQ